MSTSVEPQVLPLLQKAVSAFVDTKANPIEGSDHESRVGSLAKTRIPKKGTGKNSGLINVVKDYDWTLSPISGRDDIPYIRLLEFYVLDTQIKKQYEFYSKVVPDTIGAIGNTKGSAEAKPVLEPYVALFSKDKPTDFSYWFPYYNKKAYELTTPNWQHLDSLTGDISKISSGVGDFVSAAAEAAKTALAWTHAGAGLFDRPRVFAGHSERTINISFPLYNTKTPDAWLKNRNLIQQLMSQNLYNKRDTVTGIPPVFYEVFVPGQYYCYAAALTNINVENLGNIRLMGGSGSEEGGIIVPDAYQIDLTLSEMTMPSKNQLEVVNTGEASKFVNSSILNSKQTSQTLSYNT